MQPAPRTEEGDAKPAVIASAVIGLFPMANQGLLRDTQAMIAGDATSLPAYAQVSLSGQSSYVWSPSSSETRALQKAGSTTDRIAATWVSTSRCTTTD